jgi:CheY-like chemotaxis protein
LVVEDYENERDAIRDQLEHEGYSVDTAENVATAERSLSRRQYNAIVLDYRVPPFAPRDEEQAGGALLRKIRKADAFVPVVLLSAVVQPLQEGALVDDEVTFILHKGSAPEALPRLLHRLIHQGDFVTTVLSEWVEDNPASGKPVLAGPSGEKYSVRDALTEIRRDTSIGRLLRSELLKGLLEVYARTRS